jgi:hypothetical protein
VGYCRTNVRTGAALFGLDAAADRQPAGAAAGAGFVRKKRGGCVTKRRKV